MLSNTIDDFRNFYSRDKEKKEFFINDAVQKVLNLVSANLKNKDIEIILEIKEVKVISYENELIQVLLNIINNAKDALCNKNGKKYIFIKSYTDNEKVVIKIYDNAGGIEEDILSRIYEPYFTTKFKSQGTGIGLYMSKNITENNLEGEISTQNINFVYKDSSFFGALFELKIPLK
jgi:C4-dicarboxylate-specific signal transduction histidine kinase